MCSHYLKYIEIMRYKNKHNLTLINKNEVKENKLYCKVCNLFSETGRFCSECGEELSLIQVEISFDPNEIIKKFKIECDESSYLFDYKGNSTGEWSGISVQKDLTKFSTKHRNIIFQLDIQWDDVLNELPDRFYFMNGEMKLKL